MDNVTSDTKEAAMTKKNNLNASHDQLLNSLLPCPSSRHIARSRSSLLPCDPKDEKGQGQCSSQLILGKNNLWLMKKISKSHIKSQEKGKITEN